MDARGVRRKGSRALRARSLPVLGMIDCGIVAARGSDDEAFRLSTIKGSGPVGGPPGALPVGSTDEAAPGAPAAATAPAAAAASLDAAAVTRVFDAVVARLATGEIGDRASAVRVVVADVLAEQLSGLSEATRAGLVDRIAAALEDDPALAARLDRLLGP